MMRRQHAEMKKKNFPGEKELEVQRRMDPGSKKRKFPVLVDMHLLWSSNRQ